MGLEQVAELYTVQQPISWSIFVNAWLITLTFQRDLETKQQHPEIPCHLKMPQQQHGPNNYYKINAANKITTAEILLEWQDEVRVALSKIFLLNKRIHKFGFIKQVDKAGITAEKYQESWCLER